MAYQTDPLVFVIRGGQLESQHAGAIAVSDADGTLIARAGDASIVTFLRSAAKPFQLVPLIESGAAGRLKLTDEELAVVAGSHSGETEHVRAVSSILSKIGLKESDLQCGTHSPFGGTPAASAPSVLQNNCSGKHAGMLALAVDMGASTGDYLEENHPVQKHILDVIADVTGIQASDIKIGIDGCSALNFAVPLNAAARAFARLARKPNPDAKAQPSSPTLRNLVGDGQTWSRPDALAAIANLMMAYPTMVAGSKRFDTALMQTAAGRLVAKGGAEGFQGIGVVQSAVTPDKFKHPFGVAMKIADGDGKRGLGPAVIEVLHQLGVLRATEVESLRHLHRPVLKNHRGTEVGEVRADFKLTYL